MQRFELLRQPGLALGTVPVGGRHVKITRRQHFAQQQRRIVKVENGVGLVLLLITLRIGNLHP